MNNIFKLIEHLAHLEDEYKLIRSNLNMSSFPKALELMTDAFSSVDKLKLLLAEIDPENIRVDNDKQKTILNKIRRGESLDPIKDFEKLNEFVRSKESNESEEESHTFEQINWDKLFEIYHTKFDINSYFFDKLRVGPIITTSELPASLKKYFIELREAYAYGLHNACLALCRTLLEISFENVLKKESNYVNTNNIMRAAKEKTSYEFSLYENINIAFSLKIISKDLKKKAHNVRLSGNKAVHSDGKNLKDKLPSTIKTIEDTMTIIERLYG